MTRGVLCLEEILKLQQRIVPEMLEIMEKRYSILREVYYNQPIGRRMLSKNLELSERIVRTEVNFLKEQGFIEITTPGMMITEEGKYIIEKLKHFIYDIKGLATLENKLKEKLKLINVIIVPGSLDEDENILSEMGKSAAIYVRGMLEEDTIIALTGGTSIKKVVDNMPKFNAPNNITVVPARGGMGKNLETQANTLVSNLASKINANYKLLHVPDNLSMEAVNAMIREKGIKDILDIIYKADVLLYGIGKAEEMAKRRGLSNKEMQILKEKEAVGEAFGYYFDKKGEEIYSTPTMGLRDDHIEGVKHLIAVAGGASKAEAIIATLTKKPKGVLITDEGAARKILNIINNFSL